MRFIIQDVTALDPAALSEELITAFGTNFEISTVGTTITTNSLPEPDQAAFQAILDAHVINAPIRATAKLRETAKIMRNIAVTKLLVTTVAGHTFQGDEVSQDRMARAIIGLNAKPQSPVPTILWVLADNTPIQATAVELTEALTLAGQAQTTIWLV